MAAPPVEGGRGPLRTGAPAPAAGARLVTFVPSDEDVANPERGLYRTADLVGSDDAHYVRIAEEGFRLVGGPVRLDRFRDGPIAAPFLQALDEGFSRLRRHGLKVILRFSYNSPTGDYRNAPDAPLERVRAHIATLGPLVRDNADVLAFWQAGFIGAWGEWHSSAHGLDAPAARAAVRSALLAVLPPGRMLQVRDPRDLMTWYPRGAVAGGEAARVGLHNDCFLAGDTDMGTYSADPAARRAERAYVQATTRFVPFGGETCNPGGEAGRSTCADILAEGAATHLTYLNADYFVDGFHARWKAEGCWETVKRRLGHRLRLVRAAHPPRAVAGTGWPLWIEVENLGWAAPVNPRWLEVSLRARGDDRVVVLPVTDVDARRFGPGETTAVATTIALPRDLRAGDYDVFVGLPDPAPRLRQDPRYAIRFANRDDPAAGQAWDSQRGRFGIGTSLSVEPEPPPTK